MNYKISAMISPILALVLAALGAAQTSNSGSIGAATGAQGTNATSQQKTKKLHLSPTFSADDAYKQNCTRCHNEVPKLAPRSTKTIMRHMRVRANLTKDEAQAILEYLNE